MTAKALTDYLSDHLVAENRVLSRREKELLANILKYARLQGGTAGDQIIEVIASSLAHAPSKRACSAAGGGGCPIPGQDSEGRSIVLGPRTGPAPPSYPLPPSPPGPPSPGPPHYHRSYDGVELNGTVPNGIVRCQKDAAASPARKDSPNFLAFECVVLDDFLPGTDLENLVQYAVEHEREFRISEVVSPGADGGLVDTEHRRSRVLYEFGSPGQRVVERVRASMPAVLSGLHYEEFAIAHIEAQITASNDGDFFRWHCDDAQAETASREITFVYFFHRAPKEFRGGELRIYCSRLESGSYVPTENYRSIMPAQNRIVFFLSSLAHEVMPVQCSPPFFGSSRFTLNGWFHR